MKKEKKIINHKFLDKHTILGALLLIAFAFLMEQMVVGGIVGGLYAVITQMAMETGAYIGAIIGAFVVLAIHKRWFYPEFKGNIPTTENLGKWCLIAVGIITLIIVPDLISMLTAHANLGMPAISSLLLAAMAGTSEEVAFRALPVSYMMRQYKDEKKLLLVIGLTSVVFSLVHSSNIFMGAAISSTIMQLISALTAGVILCVLFLRSGSIIPAMLVHFLNDVYAFMNTDLVNASGVMTAEHSTREIITVLIISVIELVMAWLLLRGNGKKAIMEIWDKKWQGQASNIE